MLDWEKLFKRYVLDDEKTPYFVAVSRLSQVQARHELFLYALFVGILFAVIGTASLSTDLPHGDALVVPLYAFGIVGAAVAFGLTRQTWAAACCATTPVAALLYFLIWGFHGGLGPWDKVLLVTFSLLWLRYCWRVLAIVRTYRDMPRE